MGQPYIELRHRAPENRLRLPFPLPTADSEHSVQPGQGNRMGETPLGHQMVMEQQNQQHQQHLGHTATLTQSSESVLPGGDGMEEHLEGEDSAVKDLEDVEVKDLVDLNLNLDPEDGENTRITSWPFHYYNISVSIFSFTIKMFYYLCLISLQQTATAL